MAKKPLDDVSIGKFDILATYTYAQALLNGDARRGETSGHGGGDHGPAARLGVRREHHEVFQAQKEAVRHGDRWANHFGQVTALGIVGAADKVSELSVATHQLHAALGTRIGCVFLKSSNDGLSPLRGDHELTNLLASDTAVDPDSASRTCPGERGC